MKLIGKETYERRYPEEGIDVDKQPLFYLKKLTVGEKAAIDDSSFETDEKGVVQFRGGSSHRLKIKYSLMDWKNVTDEGGNAIVCSDDNKDKLPLNVAQWLVVEIDDLNGIGLKLTEEEKKNFMSRLSR